ncbi:MAG: alpha/beta fold hydrolase [Acidimicrobiales bacterium]
MLTAATAGIAALAAGVATEQALMARERRRPDPAAEHDFGPPADARRHRVATADGGLLHVLDHGCGRPLVLLHGVSLAGLAWHYQLAGLADRHRVVVVDQRGHGRSQAGRDGYSLAVLADDLRTVLTELDLWDAVVVGHSLGGMVLMRYCADHLDTTTGRVTALGFVSSAAYLGFSFPGYGPLLGLVTRVSETGLGLSGRIPGGHLPPTDLSYLMARHGFGPRPSPTLVALGRAMSAATPPAVVADLWGEILRLDFREVLASVQLPAAVIGGTHDRLTRWSRSEEIARALPQAELTCVRGAGHMVMLERPEEVNAALLALVARSA